MRAHNDQLCRRTFLTKAMQTTVATVASAGMGPAFAPLLLHPVLGWGVFLMARQDDGKPVFERIQCELVPKGQFHRVSISPSEKKVCFEFQTGAGYDEVGHTLYIADFDAEKRAITNLKVIANEERKRFWYAYPRWIHGESAVVYHLNNTGKGQLYVYHLEDGSTKRVSPNADADYRYPHGEAAPC